jgi:excisionase family DNA binding protein
MMNKPTAGEAGVPRRAKSAVREAGMEYWRVERVARYLDVSKKRVYQLVQERRLQAVRLGPRQMRIPRPALDAYLAELLAREEEACL